MKNKFFCPNPECPHHQPDPENNDWFSPNGSYWTKISSFVARFKCKSCNKGFSTRTFHLDYYAKKKVSYRQIFQLVSSSVNDRAIARQLGLSPDSVSNRIERLARQAIAFHTDNLAGLQLAEDLAADGFESFCGSQFFPNNINLLVGERSQLVYFFNYVLLRRKGRMTETQKRKCAELEKQVTYPQRAVEKSFLELLGVIKELMKQRQQQRITLHTDTKQDYTRALRSFNWFDDQQRAGSFSHQTTSSRQARTAANPLFPVNYMDREIRKDIANHRRETVCQARNVCNMLNRLMLYFHWHNYFKPFRIGKKAEGQYRHAEKAGMERFLYERELAGLYVRRRFLSFCKHVSGFWKKLWQKEIATPLKAGKEYLPAYARA